MSHKIPLRKKAALHLFSQYKINAAKLHELNYLFWECTLRCNLNCIHCGSDCKKETAINDMPLPDFLKVIDSIKTKVNPNKTLIVLTGGEPLLRKDIEKAGIEFYKRGFPWGLVTNGFNLNRNKFESLKQAGLRAITISFDGKEDSHNWLRGNKNSYQKALNAIQLLTTSEKIIYDVVTCVNQKNIKQLHEIYKLLCELKVKAWRLFTIFPKGRAKDNQLLKLVPNQFKQLLDFIAEKRKEGFMQINYGCEGFLGNYEKEVRDGFFFCQAGINIGSVLADGSISACPSIGSNFIQGNIYNDDFMDVWENRFEKFRNRNWMKTGICADCKHFKYCLGNGMHLREENSDDVILCHLDLLNQAK